MELKEKQHLAIASVPVQSWGPVYEAGKALKIGTIFEELDMPFFAAETISGEAGRKIPDEREQLMTQISENGFVLNDLTLYLDNHAQDEQAMALYLETAERLQQLKKEFAEKFYPLTQSCIVTCAKAGSGSWCWQEGPMPWEGACV